MQGPAELLEKSPSISHWIAVHEGFEEAASRFPSAFESTKLTFIGAPKRHSIATFFYPRNHDRVDRLLFVKFLCAIISNHLATVGAHRVQVKSSIPNLARDISASFDKFFDQPGAPASIKSIVESYFSVENFRIDSDHESDAWAPLPKRLVVRDSRELCRRRDTGSNVLAISIGKHFTKIGVLRLGTKGRLEFYRDPIALLTWRDNDDRSKAHKFIGRVISCAKEELARACLDLRDIAAIGTSLSVVVPEDRVVGVGTGFAESFDEEGVRLLGNIPSIFSSELCDVPVYTINDGDAEALGLARETGLRNTLVLKLGNELAAGHIDCAGSLSIGVNEFTKVVINIGDKGPLDAGTKIRGTAGQYISWLGIRNIAFDHDVNEELLGIVDGADVPTELCTIVNGFDSPLRKLANEIFEEVGRRIADLVAATEDMYAIENISVAGGLVRGYAGRAVVRGYTEGLKNSRHRIRPIHIASDIRALRFGCLRGAAHNVFQ